MSEAELRRGIGSFYRQVDPVGRVTLVLGAGNVSAIAILDALYSLIADGDVVALKMNPSISASARSSSWCWSR